MKFVLNLLTVVFFASCKNGQIKTDTTKNNTLSYFEYNIDMAHPNAKELMKDEFYWSPIEETAPFGSDDGFDAAYGFREWRILNPKKSPVEYLNDLIKSWQYPYFDYNEMDTSAIREYIYSKSEPDENEIQLRLAQLKEAMRNSSDNSMNNLNDEQFRELIVSASNGMGGRYLLGQDNAIIGIGFAQLVLEGKVDEDLKVLVEIALKRQLLPLLIERYDSGYQDRRKEQLTKMLFTINQTN